MMAARLGATDAQVADALWQGLPYLTGSCVEEFEVPSVADRRRRNAFRPQACVSKGFGSPGRHKCLGDRKLSVIYNNGQPTIDRNFFKSLAKMVKVNRALIHGSDVVDEESCTLYTTCKLLSSDIVCHGMVVQDEIQVARSRAAYNARLGCQLHLEMSVRVHVWPVNNVKKTDTWST